MRITCDTKDTLPLSALTEFQGGLKKRTDDDLAKIERSIKQYGFATPFFVWKHEGKNKVLDGHGRLQTLKAMKTRGEEIANLPVVYIDLPNEEAAKNLLLRICSTYGEMTAESVAEFLDGLKIDLDDIKLPDGLLDLSLMQERNDTKNDDEAPVVITDEPPISKAGEIYELGDHKLICGDSTEADTIALIMGDSKADLILTDPPYNVDLSSKNDYLNRQDKGFSNQTPIKNDNLNESQFKVFLIKAFTAMFTGAKAGASFYIFYAHTRDKEFVNALADAGYAPREVLIWVKNNFTLSYSDYKWKHEPIMYGWKDGARHNFYGALNLSTVFDKKKDIEKMTKEELKLELKRIEDSTPQDIIYEKKPLRNAEHPTMKPVELLSTLIKNSTKADDIVLDTFAGSGSTLIASAKTGRIARLVELDPHYCDVIRRRWTKWAKENGYAVGTGGLE